MPRFRILIFLLLTAFAAVLSVSAYAADRVTCMTTWDEFYLYAVIQVQDPVVMGDNTKHMSNPWEDDDIEIFLETDCKRAEDRSPNTYQMAVSASGGSSWLVGENGQPTPKPIFTFKFARKVQGTLNKQNDKDIGYTVELAIPWKEVGGAPEPGMIMGFNVINRMRGENTGFVSYSPDVKTEDDIHVPAKWGRIKFTTTPTIIAIQDGAVISRKVVNRPPVIDGTISPREWNTDLSFQIVRPQATPLPPEKQKYMMERLSLTPYHYRYQADLRKEASPGSVWHGCDGSSMLTDQPIKGMGPWFSYDQVQWHKDELAGVRDANIDIVLPVYAGSAGAKQNYAAKGLICMVQALKELKAEGKDYPLVGMLFDTHAMFSAYGAKPDLRDDEVKQTFYGMVRDFYLNVPDEFRARFELPPERGWGAANIIVLDTASWFSDFDGSFVEYCNKRFAEDFGSKLVWIGSSDFRDKADAMDGYCDPGAGMGFKFDDTGWIDVGGVGPGFDDSSKGLGCEPDTEARIRSRANGSTYRADWDALVPKSPHWLIVDSWNDYAKGTDIAASRQYGVRYASLTKINMLRFNGMRPYDAKFVKHDTPAVMYPGAVHLVSLTIRNAGTKPWYPGDGVFLASRWYKDGFFFADSGIRVPIQEVVPAGKSIDKAVGIMVVDQDRKPLEEGDYELRWELVRGRDQWFTNDGDAPLIVPVTVTASGTPGFTIVSSTAPALMKSGAAYNVKLKIRNDGPTAWTTATRIGYRWQKSSVHLGTDSVEAVETLAANESAATLPSDVQPGRVIEVTVPVSVTGNDGTALPVWNRKDLWSYQLKWDVFDGEKRLAGPEVGRFAESVAVTPDDLGPKFVGADTPEEMNADKKYTVLITIENTGTEVWDKASHAVGYHWYYLDGTEVVWDGARSQLPGTLKPGEQAVVKAQVTAPSYDGQYYLVWDLVSGDTWASTTANTRGGNTLVEPVNVVKGRLVAQDLTKSFDSDVISWDSDRKNGDFGSGLTFPAELLPPQVLTKNFENGLWPCSLGGREDRAGLDSVRRISFRYPSKLDGAKNAIACSGQTIVLKSGKYAAVHILATSAQDASESFSLVYGTTNTASTVQFTAWDAKPKFGEHAAFICLHRHSPDGDQPGKVCYLNHYTIAADPASELTSIRLPNNPAIKILAITFEKPE